MDISDYIEYIKENCNSEKIILMHLDGFGHHCPILEEEHISINHDEEEQVKTVIHEVLHSHPEFKDKSGGGDKYDEAVENKIENITQLVYNFHFETREFVRKKLRTAKSNIFNYA